LGRSAQREQPQEQGSRAVPGWGSARGRGRDRRRYRMTIRVTTT
jgi:hypothetical protein